MAERTPTPTPGPYWLASHWKPGTDIGAPVYSNHKTGHGYHVGSLSARFDHEHAAELVDLLNKGTHADRLAEALERCKVRVPVDLDPPFEDGNLDAWNEATAALNAYKGKAEDG